MNAHAHRVAAIAAVVTATLAPASAVASDNPPTQHRHAALVRQDLRSPDARDAARLHVRIVTPGPALQDLRSPDARDAARVAAGLISGASPTVRITGSRPSGFDWADAEIGAGAALGLALLLAASGAAIARHRHRAPGRPAAV